MSTRTRQASSGGIGNLVVRVPGYYIQGEIRIPRYHPHVIWHLAYITALLKGKALEQLRSDPPWPVPNDIHVNNRLIMELLDEAWIYLDWCTGKLEVAPRIKKTYEIGGEIGLAREFIHHESVQGEWWVEAVTGIPLPFKKAQKYDVDHSKIQRTKPLDIKPEMTTSDITDEVSLDILKLMSLVREYEGNQGVNLNRAYINGKLRSAGKKDIQFTMQEDYKDPETRILPEDLADLEPMLLTCAPEVFGKKRPKRARLFKFKAPVVEKFARELERFPHALSVLASSGASIEKLLDHVKKEQDWMDWYIHGHDIQPIAAPADACFSCLREICQGQTTNKKPSILLLLSSFLNVNNIHPNEGLMASISRLDRDAMILIVYGHATDETTEEQGKEISRYKAKMIEIDGSLKNRLVIVASKARTHEKCVVSSNGDWVIGSWNPCSSRPGSKQLEVILHGRDGDFCGQILTHIEPLIEDRDAITIINQLRIQIKVDLSKDSEKKAKSFYQNLDKATKNLDGFLRSSEEFKGDVQAEYENVLSSVRSCLVPFLKRARLEIINERISRDILINQIKVSEEDIFIASDRVSSSGLDRSILMDMSNPSRVGKKNVRILWGREWEEETQLDKADKEQLTEARKTIRLAQNILGPALLTSTNPMENHAKFAIFDGCRAIITSENLLSYGGEKTKYESRELGVFLYSIPVTRYIEGKAIFHRLQHFHPDADASSITTLPLEWIVDGINQFYAFKEFDQKLNYDFKKIQYIEAAILSAIDDIENDADAFDIKQSSLKKAIYERRAKSKKIPLIEHLWLEGMRSYLLMPNTHKDWIPIFEPIESELKQLEFEYLNAANLDVPKGGLQSESPANKGDDIVASIMVHMVLVKNGSFIMGDDRVPDESPAHRVTISKDFLMDKYLVTQELWQKVMGALPPLRAGQKSPKFPIFNVNYDDVKRFLQKLNSLSGSGGFDLPTEAEWEYACRAGSKSDYCFGNDMRQLEQYAWTKNNADGRLHEVGLLKPNTWGLHDMHGLMYEMVKDDRRKYSKNPEVDPVGPIGQKGFIAKGGAWGRHPGQPNFLKNCHFRCAFRGDNPIDEKSHRLSFRLIRRL